MSTILCILPFVFACSAKFFVTNLAGDGFRPFGPYKAFSDNNFHLFKKEKKKMVIGTAESPNRDLPRVALPCVEITHGDI